MNNTTTHLHSKIDRARTEVTKKHSPLRGGDEQPGQNREKHMSVADCRKIEWPKITDPLTKIFNDALAFSMRNLHKTQTDCSINTQAQPEIYESAFEELRVSTRIHRDYLMSSTIRLFIFNRRIENIRRIGEVAKLFMEAGVIVLTAFISPFRADRERVRGMVEHGDFIEIHCDAPIEICETRDVKGMYKKARAGKIAEFTGVSSTYEVPDNPELRVNTGGEELGRCVQQVLDEVAQRGIIGKPA